jgi:hypothetical protein
VISMLRRPGIGSFGSGGGDDAIGIEGFRANTDGSLCETASGSLLSRLKDPLNVLALWPRVPPVRNSSNLKALFSSS